jgi:hypothetical protein
LTDQEYKKTVETFWKGRANNLASESYVELLRQINLIMVQRIFNFQNRFNSVLRPILQMKEMVLGYKSDIKIYFHIYTTQ